MTESLAVSEEYGIRYLEGPAHGEFLRKTGDWTRLVEACSAAETRLILLHAANMPPRFFDLSSGEAAEIMQKLRVYGVRVALVCPPGKVQLSTHFPELIVEENQRTHFGFFETAEAAREWLSRA